MLREMTVFFFPVDIPIKQGKSQKIENINIPDLQTKGKVKMEKFESKHTETFRAAQIQKLFVCRGTAYQLDRQKLYFKYYTVSRHCFILACIILDEELRTIMTSKRNEIPWKGYLWMGNTLHRGFLESNSKVLSLLTPTEHFSL